MRIIRSPNTTLGDANAERDRNCRAELQVTERFESVANELGYQTTVWEMAAEMASDDPILANVSYIYGDPKVSAISIEDAGRVIRLPAPFKYKGTVIRGRSYKDGQGPQKMVITLCLPDEW